MRRKIYNYKPIISRTTRSAMQMTAVYSCVRILVEAVAELPLHLYRYKEDGSEPFRTLSSRQLTRFLETKVVIRHSYTCLFITICHFTFSMFFSFFISPVFFKLAVFISISLLIISLNISSCASTELNFPSKLTLDKNRSSSCSAL